MRKYSSKHSSHLLKKSKQTKRRRVLSKGSNTEQRRAYKALHAKYREKLKLWDSQRRNFYLKYYAPRPYLEHVKHVVVNKPIGTEADIHYLTQVGSELLGGEISHTQIDIDKCSRVWPSGVMTFCSFRHWIDLTSAKGNRRTNVSSTDSRFDDVSAYLDFCGFHKYVNRRKSGKLHDYADSNIVKIRREASGMPFLARFDEIAALVEKHSNYDSDQIEDFKSNILTEILINVTEHGVNYRDIGWYTLAQVHERSGIISVNIADNGIGIANSLKTGPQKVDLKTDEDHIYILEAFKANVSGAFSASTEKKGLLWWQQYERGQRRGNGLMYIQQSCANLGITFSLLSGRGYVQYNGSGKCETAKSNGSPVFAGTLYSLSIPIKRVRNEN